MAATEDSLDHGITDELVLGLSGSIGLVIINFAFIEQYMSGIIEATSDVVASAGLKVVRNRQYGEKRKYLVDVFGKIDALKSYQADLAAIIDRAEKITPIRSAFAHGTLTSFNKDAGEVVFAKVNPDPTKSFHEVEEVTISIENIEASAENSKRIATDIGEFASNLMDDLKV